MTDTHAIRVVRVVHTGRVLTPELAQEIATSITAAIGFNVLVTDRDGRVIGSADPTRVGSLHEASVPAG